ncbi:MAG: hypothetical protein M1831_000922 [Alyxoria varia]|nr:MAG: hypothetical protein M1831_000922 [Alyxoria varia]
MWRQSMTCFVSVFSVCVLLGWFEGKNLGAQYGFPFEQQALYADLPIFALVALLFTSCIIHADFVVRSTSAIPARQQEVNLIPGLTPDHLWKLLVGVHVLVFGLFCIHRDVYQIITHMLGTMVLIYLLGIVVVACLKAARKIFLKNNDNVAGDTVKTTTILRPVRPSLQAMHSPFPSMLNGTPARATRAAYQAFVHELHDSSPIMESSHDHTSSNITTPDDSIGSSTSGTVNLTPSNHGPTKSFSSSSRWSTNAQAGTNPIIGRRHAANKQSVAQSKDEMVNEEKYASNPYVPSSSDVCRSNSAFDARTGVRGPNLRQALRLFGTDDGTNGGLKASEGKAKTDDRENDEEINEANMKGSDEEGGDEINWTDGLGETY